MRVIPAPEARRATRRRSVSPRSAEPATKHGPATRSVPSDWAEWLVRFCAARPESGRGEILTDATGWIDVDATAASLFRELSAPESAARAKLSLAVADFRELVEGAAAWREHDEPWPGERDDPSVAEAPEMASDRRRA